MYGSATSSVQVNGHIHGPIPNRSADQQGCPLIMALYILFLNPLIKPLEQKLSGIQLGRRARTIKVVTHVDEVTKFVSSVTEFSAVEDAPVSTRRQLGCVLTPPNLKNWHLEDGDRRKLPMAFAIKSLSPFWELLSVEPWRKLQTTPGRESPVRSVYKQRRHMIVIPVSRTGSNMYTLAASPDYCTRHKISRSHKYIHKIFRRLWRGTYGKERPLGYRHRPYNALNESEVWT
jgi:hypothetical protein